MSSNTWLRRVQYAVFYISHSMCDPELQKSSLIHCWHHTIQTLTVSYVYYYSLALVKQLISSYSCRLLNKTISLLCCKATTVPQHFITQIIKYYLCLLHVLCTMYSIVKCWYSHTLIYWWIWKIIQNSAVLYCIVLHGHGICMYVTV